MDGSDDGTRTLWCGNLSENVTEEMLYELFLQAGPVQKVSIPKGRDGKQRPYGFVTYKHLDSVVYALQLFNGTSLFNRIINMQQRKTVDPPPIQYSQNCFENFLQLGEEVSLANMSKFRGDAFEFSMLPSIGAHGKQTDNNYSYKDDRRSHRSHPYQREQSKGNARTKDRNSRSHNNHKTNDYSRRDYKSNKRNYR